MDPQLQTSLHQLDQERQRLIKKKGTVMAYLLPMFIITSIIAFVLIKEPSISFFSIALLGGAAAMIYHRIISAPFQMVKNKFKSALIGQFMKDYHPDINYQYKPNPTQGKHIIRNSELVSGANSYAEEDVIIGQNKDVKFYLSEVHLENKTEDHTTTVFKGLLFRLKIHGRYFPDSQIQSRAGVLKHMFGGFTKNEEYGFSFESTDHEMFYQDLSPLFPFIRHLIQKQGDVRIKTEGDEIIIMLESNMRFLDDPHIDIDKSLFNKKYNENMAKQINSLLFIIDSFVNELDTAEIEDRLELKSLELIKKREL